MLMFYDIETVSEFETLKDLKENNELLYEERLKKKDTKRPEDFLSDTKLSEEEKQDRYYQLHSGLDGQYARICCISFGCEHKGEFVMRSFYGNDENKILTEFFNVLDKGGYVLCGYNNTYFDNAMCIQRALKYGITLPNALNMFMQSPSGGMESLPPWKFETVDLQNIVRANKTAMSLNALCGHLGIPTPKDAVIRSDLHDLHYADDYEGMIDYCEKDVYALYTAYQHMLNIVTGQGISVLPKVVKTGEPFSFLKALKEYENIMPPK